QRPPAQPARGDSRPGQRSVTVWRRALRTGSALRSCGLPVARCETRHSELAIRNGGTVIRKSSTLVLIALFVTACATTTDPNDPNGKAKRGAGVGAAAGAVVGAILGNQGGSNRTGAVIGAAAGAAIGAAIGHKM